MSPLPTIDSTARTIDEVVERLTTIIDWSRESHSRLGYFAALYRKVTVSVGDGIDNDDFEDGARMERLDVTFANRYLQALIDQERGVAPTRVWSFTFESAEAYWPIVLQHLMLGMNAHINLDLGIAAAETMRGESLEELHADFDKINEILVSLVGGVQQELADVWLTLRLFNVLLGSVDDALIGFSMEGARDEAWRTAATFWGAPESEWPPMIRRQDDKMLSLARLIRQPGIVLGAVTRIVRLGEVRDIARVIDILA